MQRKTAHVMQEQCVGCGSCERACPKRVMRVYRGMYARVINMDKCTGCGVCSDNCPVDIITMIETTV